MPNPRKILPKQRMKVERLEYESLINEKQFMDLYNRQVYFVDTDLKSDTYFKLGFSSDKIFTAGKNLIRIKGNPGMLAPNTPLLIEAVDRTGLPLKTSIYDLKNETQDKVICIDIHQATPPGDIRLTLAATALRDPNGKVMPPGWQNDINFKWTQVFEARPFTANRSDILFNEETTPSIMIEEVIKPWNKLTYNQDLVTSMGGATSTNNISRYRLTTGGNTRSKVSYRKSGGHYFITAHAFDNNILDFGGFTADMVGGILIVAEPQNPRPRSVAGYEAPEVFSPKENGDGFRIQVALPPLTGSSFVSSSTSACYSDDDTQSLFEEQYIQGAYQTTVLEFISPWEIRVKDPHTTWQGLKEETHRLFEHTQFDPSMYRLIWNQKPQKCDPTPLHELPNTGSMKNSYAHVKLTNLTPASGDVTRIKSYTRNNQSAADWVLASDMSVDALEMLYCEKETCNVSAGDFSKWGLAGGANPILGVMEFWDAEAKEYDDTGSLNDPPLSLYYQQGSDDAPPTPDSLVVGNNSGSNALTGDKHWLLYSKLFPKFKKGKMYQLEISSVSTKTQVTTWIPTDGVLDDPNIEIYISGSSFVDDVNDDYKYGKKIGSIRTSADKEKHVEQDRYNKDLTKGYKFLFVADEEGQGTPMIKINSGIWQFWDISLKPLDLFGFTPEEFEITFPTPKCDVKETEAIDFKFEFYNDYGNVSNYTAELNNINWSNRHTGVFDNIVVNKLYADFLISTASVTNLQPVTFSAGIFVEGDTTIGTHCTQSLTFNADVKLPCLDNLDGRLVTYDPNTDRLTYSTTMSQNFGAATTSLVQHTWDKIEGESGSVVQASGLSDTLNIVGDDNLITTWATGSNFVIGQSETPTFNNAFTASAGFWSTTETILSGSTTISGPTVEIGTCCTDDITIRGDIKLRCLDFWDKPDYVLSYDHVTRTVYYSDTPAGGTTTTGGCGTAFTKIGSTTDAHWNEGGTIDIFTASSCNDIFYILPGDNITFATYSAGISGSDDGIIISAPRQDNAWSYIHTDNGSGNVTSYDEHLYITGSGGIVVEAGTSSSIYGNVVVVEIDGSGITGTGGSGCTASFSSVGLITSSREGEPAGADFVFTASDCTDTIVFEQGTGIILSQSVAGTGNLNHTVHIAATPTAATPGWKTLTGDTGSTTTTAVGQNLKILGTGNINTSASVDGSGAKITINGGHCFHWGGRHLYEYTSSLYSGETYADANYGEPHQHGVGIGAGYPLMTVPYYLGLSSTDVNQSVGYHPGQIASGVDLAAELHLENCGWTVPHDGYITHLRGWASTHEIVPVSASLEVHLIKVAALASTCGDIPDASNIEAFNIRWTMATTDTNCRYILEQDRTQSLEVEAGDVLVPMWAYRPSTDTKRDRLFMMNLTIS